MGSGAFSLVEIMVVLGIVAILVAITLPALTSAFSASKLNSASQMVADSITLARQEAVAKDRDVQVRFYEITTGTQSGWRAFQVIRVEQTSAGSTLVPVTHVTLLPDGMIISPSPIYSPLLTADPAIKGTVSLPLYGKRHLRRFLFSGQRFRRARGQQREQFSHAPKCGGHRGPLPRTLLHPPDQPGDRKSHHLPAMKNRLLRARSGTGASASGFVLVTVLIVLVLLVVLVVAFLLRVTTERTNASGFRGSASARELADMAVGLVQGQISLATTQSPTNVWVSQPGMVRTYDASGTLVNAFKLYSSTNMVVTSAAGPRHHGRSFA